MRRSFILLHPLMEIAVVRWSDGSVNKFHADDSENIDDFIAVKTEAHEGITHKIEVVTLKELLDNEKDER
jgi:hypothetical protein